MGYRGNYKRVDLTGRKFWMLEVLREVEPIKWMGGKPSRRWEVRCDCGTVKEVNQIQLTRKSGATKSCGCLGKRKLYKTNGVRHYRRLYSIWFSMRARCEKPLNSDYHKYGQRGIIVCDEWKVFHNFYNDMVDIYVPGLTIERINVNGNYCKENCTWIPNVDQAKNRRTTRWVGSLCSKDACKKYGVKYDTFRQRIKRGMTNEQALGIG